MRCRPPTSTPFPYTTLFRSWARDAKNFGSAILIEWGTEPNGDWFSWNGKWNGGPGEGPERYIAAYRHIVDLMRDRKSTRLNSSHVRISYAVFCLKKKNKR